MAEAEMLAKNGRPRQQGAGKLAAAVAARCAHHRAGAQHRAVSRPGAADHARPAEIDRGGAAGGARAAPGRHPAAARRRGRRPGTAIDMHRMGTVANIVRYITAPDGTHHLVCQGEQRFQIVEYLSGWPFLVARVLRIPEPETRTLGNRGALRQSERRRPSRRSSCCRRRRPICSPRSSRSRRRRRSPIWRPPTWT